jgi:hypothetical protein
MKKFLPVFLIGVFLFTVAAQAQESGPKKDSLTLKVIGYLQPQYEYTFLGEDKNGENLDESDIYFNRVRLGVRGSVLRDFNFMALTELSPTLDGPFLLVATLSYNRFAPYLKITAGQFMSPFGLELNTPCNKLYTIDRSLFVENLSGSFQDIGIMLSGGTGNRSFFGSKTQNFFGYKLAILNGTGINTSDNNRKKDIVARITLHPWEFITIGASYRRGKHPSSVAWEKDAERMGIAFDVELKYKRMLLQSQYIFASDNGSYTTGGGCCSGPIEVHRGSVDRDGFMVQVMYMTPWKVQPLLKFDRYDPNVNINAEEDPELFFQNTLTCGLNYYLNKHIRFQLNYIHKIEEKAVVEFDNNALICQFQVNF